MPANVVVAVDRPGYPQKSGRAHLVEVPEVLAVQGNAGVLVQDRRAGGTDQQHELIGVKLRRRSGLPDRL